MPGTTDIEGAAFGNPTKDELAYLARMQAANADAAARTEVARLTTSAQEEKAARDAGAITGTGLLTKYHPSRATEAQAFTRASLASRELGDPTSYGGQAPLSPDEISQGGARVDAGQQDFAKPLQVIRRTTSTFQGPAAGTEYATEGQAAQAFRRNLGEDFVPVGGAMENLKGQNRVAEINAQGKSQEATLAGEAMTRKRNLEAFTNRVQSDPRFYKEGPEGLTPINPGLGQLLLGFKAMGEVDPEKAFQAFESKATRHLDETKWVNEQGIAKAVDNLTKAGYILTPGQKSWLVTPQGDPEAEKKRRDTILQWVNPTAIPTGTRETGPSASQPLSLEPMSFKSPGETLPFQLSTRPGPAALQPLPIQRGLLLMRPDMMGNLAENLKKEEAQKNHLAKLSAEYDERLGLR